MQNAFSPSVSEIHDGNEASLQSIVIYIFFSYSSGKLAYVCFRAEAWVGLIQKKGAEVFRVLKVARATYL